VVGHGIGERGDGSLTALKKVMSFPGMPQLMKAAKVYGFKQLYLNTNSGYTQGEYEHILKVAKAIPGADSAKFHYIGLSWGGYGFNNWIGKSYLNARQFATSRATCGCGVCTPSTTTSLARLER
jgi:hypothetical protein